MIMKVSIANQQLSVWHEDVCIKQYSISTAKKGPGEKEGSEQTPRGWHIVRAKIGDGALPNAVFVGRRLTGEIYHPALHVLFPQRDWILTRILWLSGLERGKNRLGEVDTMRRYIYIHGVPDETPMGIALSKGCIRMRNRELIALFNLIPVGTKILIE